MKVFQLMEKKLINKINRNKISVHKSNYEFNDRTMWKILLSMLFTFVFMLTLSIIKSM